MKLFLASILALTLSVAAYPQSNLTARPNHLGPNKLSSKLKATAPTWIGWLGSDALPGAKIGAQVVVGAGAGPVRTDGCGTASQLSPQPASYKGSTVLIIGGPASCSGGIAYWKVTNALPVVTPPPPTTTPVPCTATYTNATGALAINCTLSANLSSKLQAVAVQSKGLGSPVLRATSGHTVALKWMASADAGVAYNIYRIAGTCPSSGLTGFSKIAIGLTTTTYTDPNVIPGTYCYSGTATLSGLESVPSNYATASVLPAPPAGFGCNGSITGQSVDVNCTPTE